MLMKANLVELVRPGLINDAQAYWATHVYAILSTLTEQTNLTYRFYGKTIPPEAPQTLATLCGNAPANFLKAMDRAVQNFGLQYFLGTYLMSEEGLPCLAQLLRAICESRNVDLLSDKTAVSVHVCGKDSISGRTFLNQTQAYVFGANGLTFEAVAREIEYADLCILLYSRSGEHPTALLGEVEGVRGDKLGRPSYWERKSPYCCFGIGVYPGVPGMSELFTAQFASGLRTIMRFSSRHPVVSDFHKALTVIIDQMNHSRHAELRPGLGLTEVMSIVRLRWNDPIDLLLSELQEMSRTTAVVTDQQAERLFGLTQVPAILM